MVFVTCFSDFNGECRDSQNHDDKIMRLLSCGGMIL